MKRIEIIPSKSDAHRAIIAAGLSNQPCDISIEHRSKDIDATMDCMASIRRGLANSGASVELRCGESGSTMRFLLPIMPALGLTGDFYPEGRLPERPLSPLYEELEKHGATLSPMGSVPFRVEGKLSAGEYHLPGNVSSQYITGLLYALPLLEADSDIVIHGERQSMGYVELTRKVLQQFGIHSEENERDGCLVYHVTGNQQYHSPAHYDVEGDWSNAAFWLAAGILGDEAVQVTGLRPDSTQGDLAIVDLIKAFGGTIEATEESFTAVPSRELLRGITIDASQIPDLVPILALIASVAIGETRIEHAERLRLKESDRLESVTAMLTALGVDIQELPDGLIIQGGNTLHAGTIDSVNDHRIAMTAGIASLLTEQPIHITGAGAVAKSYPDFYEIMKRNHWDNIELD